jgi:hypothetical protein
MLASSPLAVGEHQEQESSLPSRSRGDNWLSVRPRGPAAPATHSNINSKSVRRTRAPWRSQARCAPQSASDASGARLAGRSNQQPPSPPSQRLAAIKGHALRLAETDTRARGSHRLRPGLPMRHNHKDETGTGHLIAEPPAVAVLVPAILSDIRRAALRSLAALI